ncbi:MAG: tetratricopeptide repeat protein [Planctomycetes bacterium]|nr:tetratricopeptide repeat protein [Planctomycetota bacterium]
MIFEDDHNDDTTFGDWSRAEKNALKAFELYEDGQIDKALAAINEAIEVNPSCTSWHFNKALALDALERFDEAIEEYKLALETNPDDIEILNCLAIDYTRLCQHTLALKIFERMENIDPQFEPAYCNRIITYTEMNDHETAEQMFYMAQQVNENCPLCYYNLGNSFFIIKEDYKRAIWCWEKTLQLASDHPQINYRIAQGYWADGNIEKARQYFLAELRNNPGDIDVLFDFGIFLLKNTEIAAATEKFNRILELDPDFAPALHYLGEISLNNGEESKAGQLFRSALDKDPALAGPRYRLAQSALENGDEERTVGLLLGELELDPQDGQLLMSIGTMMMQLSQNDYAAHCFLKVADIEPLNADNYCLLGQVMAMQESFQDALEFFENAVKLNPNNVLALKSTAITLLALGKTEEAVAMIKANSLISNDIELILLRGRIHIAFLAQKLKNQFRKLLPKSSEH